MDRAEPQCANSLLRMYLECSGPDCDPEDLLARLVIDFGQPTVQRVVRHRLSTARGLNTADIEDVCSEAMAELVARLRSMRETRGGAVADFDSYSAGLAGHVAFRFFAARFPERSRLRNRIRYILSTDARFRIWRAAHGSWLCDLASEKEPRLRVRPGKRLADMVSAVLTEVAGAIEIGDLTSRIANLLGVTDRSESTDILSESLLDPGSTHARQFELRQWLGVLWGEIAGLPQTQRAALLLNLRSTSGAGLWLFTDLRIVRFRELASSLGLSAERMAELWNRLPLEDSEIAAHFGIERQQVINLRSAARQRLVRRMKNWERSVMVGNTSQNSGTT